jgi:UDP-N-acetylmuramyl pentapeptide phosphotransferase/UDP-N-acetylglucosamine-1-phosphate transferase
MDYNYIKIILLYLFINFIIFIVVAKVSYESSLIDVPNKRKSHPKPTAYTGGLALILSYIFALYLFNFPDQKFDIILSIASLVGLVGFIDDKYNLNVGGKLSLQIIPIIYLIFKG